MVMAVLNPIPKRTLLSWSSGKDSAWTLGVLRRRPDVHVVGLLTTVNEKFRRVSMHGVRERLLEKQAKMIGLPLNRIRLPFPCSNADYEQRMEAFFEEIASLDIDSIAFGDLFLEDIRAYRETQMKKTSIEPIFPIWGMDTATLAQTMVRRDVQLALIEVGVVEVRSGLKAKVTCIDPKRLEARFAGREFDAAFLNDLPKDVDHCGENGEFHTFVYDGPVFKHRIDVRVGEIVNRDGFVFADVL